LPAALPGSRLSQIRDGTARCFPEQMPTELLPLSAMIFGV
jgi:hypothetical protein